MPVSERREGRRLVIAPHEPLVGGGAAEEFERRVQALFRDGFRHLIADLRSVPSIDSAGVRALVRGHTTAQRLQGSFRIVAPTSNVQTVLHLSHLESVLALYDSVDEARAGGLPWKAIRLAGSAVLLCAALIAAGIAWPESVTEAPSGAPPGFQPGTANPLGPPFLQLAKLVAAALIGVLVTGVHRYTRSDSGQSQTMDQAQVLLCVSGAMMMVIIGNSLARAFGIAGAASIIRFRTPVDDPRDITILFLLMGLGMAAGLGAFAVAGLGTVFLCFCLATLHRFGGGPRPRTMLVEVVADGRNFPTAHVQSVFASNHVVFEPREVSQGSAAAIQYQATINPGMSIEDLSAQLMAGSAGVKSVSWEPAKRLF